MSRDWGQFLKSNRAQGFEAIELKAEKRSGSSLSRDHADIELKLEKQSSSSLEETKLNLGRDRAHTCAVIDLKLGLGLEHRLA